MAALWADFLPFGHLVVVVVVAAVLLLLVVVGVEVGQVKVMSGSQKYC